MIWRTDVLNDASIDGIQSIYRVVGLAQAGPPILLWSKTLYDTYFKKHKIHSVRWRKFFFYSSPTALKLGNPNETVRVLDND